MSDRQPIVSDATGTRQFACSPAAVMAFIVNAAGQLLLLAHPQGHGAWEVISGALETGETILAAVLREVGEEIGLQVRVRPLGTVHALTVHYDEKVPYLLSLGYLLAYEGGEVQPGDDMRGSHFRWWSLKELEDECIQVTVPGQRWLLKRAVELYHLWKDQVVELQPEGSLPARRRYSPGKPVKRKNGE